MGILYYGDNLEIMRKYIKDESIDLIYLDPPFNSKATYNILFKEANGTASRSQIEAFSDFWHWDKESQKTFEYLTTSDKVPINVSKLVNALHDFLGNNDMSAYLVMMTVRLLEMKRILKSTGLLYLHCDPTVSHYLKLVLDAVFGEKNFRNEIVWCYAGGGIPKNDFPRKHDIIFRYSKSDTYYYKPEYREYSETTIKVGGGRHSLTSGGAPLDLERGTPINDWWVGLSKLTSYQKEWLGYQTQKPLSLLERIIKTSSKEGDVVLDPFCGCGTTIDAAEKLGRQWIGIDITHLAINLIKNRIKDKYNNAQITVIGEPMDLESAKALANQDRYQFEWWALSLVGARPIGEKKKGADKGIDGERLLSNPLDKTIKRVLVQVKSGHISSSQIRDFRGTIEREKADFGIFITLEPPTKDMLTEAVSFGYAEDPLIKEKIQRIQIMTIEQLLNGEQPKLPFLNVTYPRAVKDDNKSKNTNKKQLHI